MGDGGTGGRRRRLLAVAVGAGACAVALAVAGAAVGLSQPRTFEDNLLHTPPVIAAPPTPTPVPMVTEHGVAIPAPGPYASHPFAAGQAMLAAMPAGAPPWCSSVRNAAAAQMSTSALVTRGDGVPALVSTYIPATWYAAATDPALVTSGSAPTRLGAVLSATAQSYTPGWSGEGTVMLLSDIKALAGSTCGLGPSFPFLG